MATIAGAPRNRHAIAGQQDGVPPAVAPLPAASPSIHPLTLSFSDRVMEQEFRAGYARWLLGLTRLNIVLAALLFVAFALVDPLVLDHATGRAALLRFGVYLPFSIAMFVWSFHPSFVRYLTRALCCSALLAGGITILMFTWANEVGQTTFYAGVMLICTYILVLTRLRVVYAAPITWALVIGFLLVLYLPSSLAPTYRVTTPLSLLSIQVMGTIACYIMERQHRTQYLGRLIIEQRTAQLDEALETARAAQHRAEELHQRAEELRLRAEELAARDPLTELPNRRQFFLTAEREIERCRGQGLDISVAVIDLDHFKLINDRHGHLVGDSVLCAVAGCVRAGVRPGDVLCRYGGEEFVILFPGVDATAAVMIAERLRAAIEQLAIVHRGEPIPMTASIGLATWPPVESAPFDRLIDEADQALYQAKAAGRNRVVHAAVPVASQNATLPSPGHASPGGADRCTQARDVHMHHDAGCIG